ncbi:conserved Plasmodium protein, unknown function [Plasmodium relictum]|uniref:Uncharacterized protein n=1 Tax=Plasmodium relictum TaxID=85471 RepID=A0A1J1H8R0_PLARL|nr:conserved Plasmodium protein, unknown function [Plasmodium relictum]CRH01300.1 conserved Plasmodium protein, unknown function [Plasmodium relictum]
MNDINCPHVSSITFINSNGVIITTEIKKSNKKMKGNLNDENNYVFYEKDLDHIKSVVLTLKPFHKEFEDNVIFRIKKREDKYRCEWVLLLKTIKEGIKNGNNKNFTDVEKNECGDIENEEIEEKTFDCNDIKDIMLKYVYCITYFDNYIGNLRKENAKNNSKNDNFINEYIKINNDFTKSNSKSDHFMNEYMKINKGLDNDRDFNFDNLAKNNKLIVNSGTYNNINEQKLKFSASHNNNIINENLNIINCNKYNNNDSNTNSDANSKSIVNNYDNINYDIKQKIDNKNMINYNLCSSLNNNSNYNTNYNSSSSKVDDFYDLTDENSLKSYNDDHIKLFKRLLYNCNSEENKVLNDFNKNVSFNKLGMNENYYTSHKIKEEITNYNKKNLPINNENSVADMIDYNQNTLNKKSKDENKFLQILEKNLNILKYKKPNIFMNDESLRKELVQFLKDNEQGKFDDNKLIKNNIKDMYQLEYNKSPFYHENMSNLKKISSDTLNYFNKKNNSNTKCNFHQDNVNVNSLSNNFLELSGASIINDKNINIFDEKNRKVESNNLSDNKNDEINIELIKLFLKSQIKNNDNRTLSEQSKLNENFQKLQKKGYLEQRKNEDNSNINFLLNDKNFEGHDKSSENNSIFNKSKNISDANEIQIDINKKKLDFRNRKKELSNNQGNSIHFNEIKHSNELSENENNMSNLKVNELNENEKKKETKPLNAHYEYIVSEILKFMIKLKNDSSSNIKNDINEIDTNLLNNTIMKFVKDLTPNEMNQLISNKDYIFSKIINDKYANEEKNYSDDSNIKIRDCIYLNTNNEIPQSCNNLIVNAYKNNLNDNDKPHFYTNTNILQVNKNKSKEKHYDEKNLLNLKKQIENDTNNTVNNKNLNVTSIIKTNMINNLNNYAIENSQNIIFYNNNNNNNNSNNNNNKIKLKEERTKKRGVDSLDNNDHFIEDGKVKEMKICKSKVKMKNNFINNNEDINLINTKICEEINNNNNNIHNDNKNIFKLSNENIDLLYNYYLHVCKNNMMYSNLYKNNNKLTDNSNINYVNNISNNNIRSSNNINSNKNIKHQVDHIKNCLNINKNINNNINMNYNDNYKNTRNVTDQVNKMFHNCFCNLKNLNDKTICNKLMNNGNGNGNDNKNYENFIYNLKNNLKVTNLKRNEEELSENIKLNEQSNCNKNNPESNNFSKSNILQIFHSNNLLNIIKSKDACDNKKMTNNNMNILERIENFKKFENEFKLFMNRYQNNEFLNNYQKNISRLLEDFKKRKTYNSHYELPNNSNINVKYNDEHILKAILINMIKELSNSRNYLNKEAFISKSNNNNNNNLSFNDYNKRKNSLNQEKNINKNINNNMSQHFHNNMNSNMNYNVNLDTVKNIYRKLLINNNLSNANNYYNNYCHSNIINFNNCRNNYYNNKILNQNLNNITKGDEQSDINIHNNMCNVNKNIDINTNTYINKQIKNNNSNAFNTFDDKKSFNNNKDNNKDNNNDNNDNNSSSSSTTNNNNNNNNHSCGCFNNNYNNSSKNLINDEIILHKENNSNIRKKEMNVNTSMTNLRSNNYQEFNKMKSIEKEFSHQKTKTNLYDEKIFKNKSINFKNDNIANIEGNTAIDSILNNNDNNLNSIKLDDDANNTDKIKKKEIFEEFQTKNKEKYSFIFNSNIDDSSTISNFSNCAQSLQSINDINSNQCDNLNMQKKDDIKLTEALLQNNDTNIDKNYHTNKKKKKFFIDLKSMKHSNLKELLLKKLSYQNMSRNYNSEKNNFDNNLHLIKSKNKECIYKSVYNDKNSNKCYDVSIKTSFYNSYSSYSSLNINFFCLFDDMYENFFKSDFEDREKMIKILNLDKDICYNQLLTFYKKKIFFESIDEREKKNLLNSYNGISLNKNKNCLDDRNVLVLRDLQMNNITLVDKEHCYDQNKDLLYNSDTMQNKIDHNLKDENNLNALNFKEEVDYFKKLINEMDNFKQVYNIQSNNKNSSDIKDDYKRNFMKNCNNKNRNIDKTTITNLNDINNNENIDLRDKSIEKNGNYFDLEMEPPLIEINNDKLNKMCIDKNIKLNNENDINIEKDQNNEGTQISDKKDKIDKTSLNNAKEKSVINEGIDEKKHMDNFKENFSDHSFDSDNAHELLETVFEKYNNEEIQNDLTNHKNTIEFEINIKSLEEENNVMFKFISHKINCIRNNMWNESIEELQNKEINELLKKERDEKISDASNDKKDDMNNPKNDIYYFNIYTNVWENVDLNVSHKLLASLQLKKKIINRYYKNDYEDKNFITFSEWSIYNLIISKIYKNLDMKKFEDYQLKVYKMNKFQYELRKRNTYNFGIKVVGNLYSKKNDQKSKAKDYKLNENSKNSKNSEEYSDFYDYDDDIEEDDEYEYEYEDEEEEEEEEEECFSTEKDSKHEIINETDNENNDKNKINKEYNIWNHIDKKGVKEEKDSKIIIVDNEKKELNNLKNALNSNEEKESFEGKGNNGNKSMLLRRKRRSSMLNVNYNENILNKINGKRNKKLREGDKTEKSNHSSYEVSAKQKNNKNKKVQMIKKRIRGKRNFNTMRNKKSNLYYLIQLPDYASYKELIKSKSECLPTYILQYEQLKKNECIFFNIQNHYNSFINNVYHFAISYEQSLKHNEYLNNTLNNVKARLHIKRLCLKKNITIRDNIYDICNTYFNDLYTYDSNHLTFFFHNSKKSKMNEMEKMINNQDYYSNYVNDYLENETLKKKKKKKNMAKLNSVNNNQINELSENLIVKKEPNYYNQINSYINDDSNKKAEYKNSLINDESKTGKTNDAVYSSSDVDNKELCDNLNYVNFLNDNNNKNNDFSLNEKAIEDEQDVGNNVVEFDVFKYEDNSFFSNINTSTNFENANDKNQFNNTKENFLNYYNKNTNNVSFEKQEKRKSKKFNNKNNEFLFNGSINHDDIIQYIDIQ